MSVQRYPHIFRPLQVGRLTFKNRIEAGPAVPMLASEDGMVTDALLLFTQELARSGAGVVTVGDSAVDHEFAPGHMNQLNLGDPRVIPGLARLVRAIERHGAVASIEINHSGRFVPPLLLKGRRPWGPSNVRSKAEEQFRGEKGREAIAVHEMTAVEIQRVIKAFADAAEHCRMAGFRMLTLHGAHGHLLMQFLSPLSNRRTDIYGGSFENRCLFPLEVIDAIRARVGRDMVIQYRVSADEEVEGSLHFDEVTRFLKLIESRIDIVQVSYGSICEPCTAPTQMQPLYVPRGILVRYAEELKSQLGIPVSTLGGITMEMAEELLAAGRADMVTMVRNLLADRRLVNKYRVGREGSTRPCIRCGTCTEQSTHFRPVVCAVNPMIGRESEFTEIRPARVSKRVVIAGGGPAGMQAAYTAARRGHRVILLEKTDHLGGNLVLAAAHFFKQDMRRYLRWLTAQMMEDPAIDVRLCTEANAARIEALHPDAVLLAIGAKPFMPAVPGIEKALWVGDVTLGNVPTGARVLIVGGGLTGLEEALDLAQQGKSVTVADILPVEEFGRNCNGIPKISLMQLLKHYHVAFEGDLKLCAVLEHGAAFERGNGERIEREADTVIASMGFRIDRAALAPLLSVAADTALIGDCVRPDNIEHAVSSGFNAAYEL